MYAYSSPPMWSFGDSKRGEELKAFTNYYTPGPGNYDQVEPETVKDAYPSWKVGTSKRQNLYGSSNEDVGPGSYEATKADGKKHPKNTFGKSKRGHSEFKGISTVGPDAYNPKGFSRAPPSFSFGYKTDGFGSNWTSDVPGPGAYEIKNNFEQPEEAMRHTRSAFNRTAPQARTVSREPGFGSSDLPGPGTHFTGKVDKNNYDFRYFTPTWSFGKSNRDDLYNETKVVPGPGKYNANGSINTKTGFTILGKHKAKGNTNYTPAPNVYNQDINPLRQTAPAFRIGKAERKDMSTGHPELPGPGAYFHPPTYEEVEFKEKKKGVIKTFGTSSRPPLYSTEGTPGPGEYEVRGNITKGKKYSMGLKGGVKKTTEVYPGPGEYEPFGSLYLEKNNGAIIGTSERPMLYKKGAAPGPGQYDITGEIGIGTKSMIGNGKRPPMTKASDEPGPGYYNIPSAIANVQKYLLPYYADEKRRTQHAQEASFRGIFGANSD